MIYKLLSFTVAMIVLPIGSYFITVNPVFRGWYFSFYFKEKKKKPLAPNPSNPLSLSFTIGNAHCGVQKGDATYAGAFAAIVANVVLIGYIVVAMREDQSDRKEAEEAKRAKKAR